jgi:glycosyltransferase involved in cell wall biosynthesis
VSARRVLVLESQTPFVRGGAEILVRELVGALRIGGYEADLVSIPFRDSPRDELMAHAAVWRLIDLRTALERNVDVVIPTKFPTYFVRHPAKVAWLVHQHRAAYELCGTPYSDFDHTERDVGLRKQLIDLDTRMLTECAGLFTIARTVSARVEQYNGLQAEALYHPPRLAAAIRAGAYGDYMLAVSRLEKVKRLDLAIEAFAHVPAPLRLLIAGEGSVRADLEARIERLQLGHRVQLLGQVDDQRMLELLAGARGILFAPFQEDYGYVTLEAFLAHKPVVTSSDAGGPLEFVEDGVNGFVRDATPDAIAEAVVRLGNDANLARRLGEQGYERARRITWEGVVDRLVGAGLRPVAART